ncbi:MAG: hypothetical protein K6T91_05805 [Firmicutes bacterium]|nr:hypothetical protein [Bacillota bacterium]
MAREAIFERVLRGVGLSVRKANPWSVLSVEKMLSGLGIENCKFDYQAKKVELPSQKDLLKIIEHLMPLEISADSTISITEYNGSRRLRLGYWQFEAKN